METEIAVSSELKYTKKEFSHPKYKLSQIYPIQGSNTQNVSSAGGLEIIFQLPTKCINLSKSFLNYTFAQNARTSAGNDTTYYNNKNPLVGIRQIQLYTQSGVYLADIYYLNKYMDVVYYAETKNSEFQTNENGNGISVTNYEMYASPNFSTGQTNTTGDYSQRVVTNAAGVIVAPANNNGAYAVPQYERQYVEQGVHANAAAGYAITINSMFKMKNIFNSIFSIDKDLYFPEILYLRIVFDGCTTVAGQGAYNDITTIADVTSNLLYSNILFYVAVEQDIAIANQIVSKVNTEGLSLPIPYIYSYKQNLTSGLQTLSLRLNRAHGKKLRRIYHAPFHNTETNLYAFMRDNIGGGKTIANFYTMLNNERETDINIDCTLAQDYMVLKSKLTGSPYFNVDTYQYKWFWVCDYTSEGPLCEKESQDINLSSGIPLEAEQKWDIYMTLSAGAGGRYLNHYDFVITEKELTIRPNGITIV